MALFERAVMLGGAPAYELSPAMHADFPIELWTMDRRYDEVMA